MTQNKTFQKKHINTNNMGFQAAKRNEMIFVSVFFFGLQDKKKERKLLFSKAVMPLFSNHVW